MAEVFDRAAKRLTTVAPLTVYQAPSDQPTDRATITSCIASYVADDNALARIELWVADANGALLSCIGQQGLISRGMSIEMLPSKFVLNAGERLAGLCVPAGKVELTVSALATDSSTGGRRVGNVEAFVSFPPPDAVGSNKNVVEVPGAIAVTTTFLAPQQRNGETVRPPALPTTVATVPPVLAFGPVTIAPAGLSATLQAEVPFVGAAVTAVSVPALAIGVAAQAPTTATGDSVSPSALSIQVSASNPEVVTTGALDSDALAYITAVETADGQALEDGIKLAYNDFIVGCKTDGIWSAIKASCILAGARTLDGALTPLAGAPPADYGFWGLADAHWSNVSLLLRMNGANNSTLITDSSSNGYTISTGGNIKLVTNQSVTGGSSLYSDGTNDYLTFSNAAVAFGANDFTFEFWLKLEANTTAYPYIFSSSIYNANGGFYIVVNGPATGWGGIGLLSFVGSTGSSGAALSSTSSVRDGSWHHVAITRSGADHYLFIDGNLEDQELAASANYTGNGAVVFSSIGTGTSISNTSSDKGWMDELRVTKGHCRYTSSFTPPTRPAASGTADYSRVTGLVGDGSAKYLDSGRSSNSDPQNNMHYSIHVVSPGSTGIERSHIGTAFSGTANSDLNDINAFADNRLAIRSRNANADAGVNLFASPAGSGTGFMGAGRSASGSYTVRRNGASSVVSSGLASTSYTPSSSTYAIFARSGNPASTYSNARISFYSIGESLDLALLDARVTRLVEEIAFVLNTGLPATGYDIDTLKYVNAGYAAGGTLS